MNVVEDVTEHFESKASDAELRRSLASLWQQGHSASTDEFVFP